MGKSVLPPFGHDSTGNPVTAGGERVDRSNYVTKEKYMQERAILDNYNKIKNLNHELADLRHGAKRGRGPAERPRSRQRDSRSRSP